MSRRLRNPVFATIALLLAGAAFAGIIIVSYPGDKTAENTPVVQAEQTAFKVQPDEAGGMNIPHDDSTIFQTTRSPVFDGSAPVENLLEQQEEAAAPVSKLEAFAQDAEAMMEELDEDTVSAEAVDPEAGAVEEIKSTIAEIPEAENDPAPAVQTITQDVEKIPPKDLLAGTAETTPPKVLYKPGGSPETLEFVRSVLDKKDGKGAVVAQAEPSPQALNAVEPAAGAAVSAGSFTGGGEYFVQLASVTSAEGAEAEWGKIQKTFIDYLTGVPHRVKQADLGERGTYYRIQAGPFSKDQASSLCESIKAQKPGGCLVVK